MDLKKGLSFVAFGFLFTLVNLNLTLNGVTVNVTPAFIGWILFFCAHGRLGDYVSGKRYLQWISLVLVVLTGFVWFSGIMSPEMDTGALTTVGTVLSTVYMFILFGSLEKMARDFGSRRESTIRALKYLNLILYLVLTASAVLVGRVHLEILAVLVSFLGAAAIVSAVVTLVVLFRLRRDVADRLSDAE